MIAVIALFACGDRNARSPLPMWHLAETPQVTLGVVAGDTTQEFGSVVAARFDASLGLLLVADRLHNVVRVFDTTGSFIASLGGPGLGPGEVNSIDALFVSRDTVRIVDELNDRVALWTPSGAYLDTKSLLTVVGHYRTVADRCGGGSYLTFAFAGVDPGTVGVQTEMAAVVFGPPGARIVVGDAVANVFWRRSHVIRTGSGTTGYPAPLSPHGFGACADDGWWYRSGDETTLIRRSVDGRVEFRTSLPIDRRRVTQADRARYEDDWVGSVSEGARPRLRTALREMDFPDFVPTIDRMMRARDNDIWVRQFDPSRAGRRRWFVISPNGTLMATVDIPADVELMEAGRNNVVIKTRDELGVERISLYGVLSEVG